MCVGWLCKGWPAACLGLVVWLVGWLVGSRAAQWACVSVCRVGWPGADWVAGCWVEGTAASRRARELVGWVSVGSAVLGIGRMALSWVGPKIGRFAAFWAGGEVGLRVGVETGSRGVALDFGWLGGLVQPTADEAEPTRGWSCGCVRDCTLAERQRGSE